MPGPGKVVNEGRFFLLPRREWLEPGIAPIFAYAREHGFWAGGSDGPDVDEVLAMAGLDWQVDRAPVYASLGPQLPGMGGVPVPGFKALVRHDTDGPLSVVTSDYAPIQNREAAHAALHLARQASDTWGIKSAYPPRLVAAAAYGRARSQGVYVVDLGVSQVAGSFLVARNGHGDGRALTMDLIEVDDTGVVLAIDMPGIGTVRVRESHLGRVKDRLHFSSSFTEEWGDKLLEVLFFWSYASTWDVSADDCEALVTYLWPGNEKSDPMPAGGPVHPRAHLLRATAEAGTLGMAYRSLCEYIDRRSEARERGDATKDRLERLAAGAGTKLKERALAWLLDRAEPPEPTPEP